MKISYNKNFPVIVSPELNIDLKEISDQPNFKNADLTFAYENSHYKIRNLIDKIKNELSVNTHKYVLMDLKLQDLKYNKFSCVPGWHCDTTMDPYNNSKREEHYLFVSGGSPTEFVSEEIFIDMKKDDNYLNKVKQTVYGLKPRVETIPLNTWVKYGRFDLHRGVKPEKDHKRLLIRITKTDIVKPNFKLNPKLYCS